MNGKIQALTGSSLTVLFILFATHGKAFLEALGGLPALLAAFASKLPGGVLSILLSLTVASLFYSFVKRWLKCVSRDRRELGAQLFALCMGLGVAVALQAVTGHTAPPDLLQAVLIGLIAGLSAPKLVLILSSFKTSPAKP